MADPDPEPSPDQYGALAWRIRDGRPEYVLVTSRRTSRWIMPKGGIDGSESPAEAAAREAAEEAGVEGKPGKRPIGRYTALKVGEDDERLLTVELWPVEIERLRDDWPEKRQRQRRIVRLEEALSLVGQEDMRRLIAAFEAVIRPE